MLNRLARLEAEVEALIEGTFARIFSDSLQPKDLLVPLARALEDSAAQGAPATRYVVRLHPADAQAVLGNQPRLAEALGEDLLALAREAQLTLPCRPEVLIIPDASLRPRTARVSNGSPADKAHTQGMIPVQALPGPGAPGEREATAPHAFLIIDGQRTMQLAGPVIRLGRRLDNDVILDDARVSRAHAQIRLRYGRYVLYDLGSSGGTLVNGQAVQECVLQPGDVISLAGLALIYGEEDAPPRPAVPGSGATLPSGPERGAPA